MVERMSSSQNAQKSFWSFWSTSSHRHFRHVQQRPFALQPLFGLSGTAHIIVMSDNGHYSSPDEKREQPTIPGTGNVRVVHEHRDGSIHWSRFLQFVLLSIGVSTVLFLIANLQQQPLESTPKLFKPTTYEIVPGFFAQSLNSTNDATFDFVPLHIHESDLCRLNLISDFWTRTGILIIQVIVGYALPNE